MGGIRPLAAGTERRQRRPPLGSPLTFDRRQATVVGGLRGLESGRVGHSALSMSAICRRNPARTSDCRRCRTSGGLSAATYTPVSSWLTYRYFSSCQPASQPSQPSHHQNISSCSLCRLSTSTPSSCPPTMRGTICPSSAGCWRGCSGPGTPDQIPRRKSSLSWPISANTT